MRAGRLGLRGGGGGGLVLVPVPAAGLVVVRAVQWLWEERAAHICRIDGALCPEFS